MSNLKFYTDASKKQQVFFYQKNQNLSTIKHRSNLEHESSLKSRSNTHTRTSSQVKMKTDKLLSLIGNIALLPRCRDPHCRLGLLAACGGLCVTAFRSRTNTCKCLLFTFRANLEDLAAAETNQPICVKPSGIARSPRGERERARALLRPRVPGH